MTVLCVEEGYQLRVYLLVGAEITFKETAYEVSVYWCLVSWEMYVFQLSVKFFQIILESFEMGRFACAVKSFYND